MTIAAAPYVRPPALKIALLFVGLYAGQGIVGSLVQSALPVVMRAQGVGLDKIGWLSLLFLPWVVKFLWAPLLDRYSAARSLGRRRSWILLCQAVVIACLAVSTFVPPSVNFDLLILLLVVAIFFAATQDTATDAFAVEVLEPERRRLGGSAQVAGGYLGFALGIGLWLPIYQHFGWAPAMGAMVACMILGSLPLWLSGSLDAPVSPAPTNRRSALVAAFKDPLIRRGLLFIVIYQIGSRLGVAMLGPYFVDAGLPIETIGYVKGSIGPLVGFTGALTGGWLLKRVSNETAMRLAALMHGGVYIALATAAYLDVRSLPILATLGMLEAFSFSLIFVALYTAMMGWCRSSRVGTDFAILQSADALLAVAASVLAGQIGHNFGHAANFALSAGLLLVAGLFAMRHLPASHSSC
jgi:MFS transporter (putative signal transducer)